MDRSFSFLHSILLLSLFLLMASTPAAGNEVVLSDNDSKVVLSDDDGEIVCSDSNEVVLSYGGKVILSNEDKQAAQTLMHLSSLPLEVYMLSFCKYGPFKIMGPLLIRHPG